MKGAVVSDYGFKPEKFSRILQAIAALTKLVFSIFLHACELWTLTVELEKRAQAFEMRYY